MTAPWPTSATRTLPTWPRRRLRWSRKLRTPACLCSPAGWTASGRAWWPPTGRLPMARTRRPRRSLGDSWSSTCAHARRLWRGLPRSPSRAAVLKRSACSCPARTPDRRAPRSVHAHGCGSAFEPSCPTASEASRLARQTEHPSLMAASWCWCLHARRRQELENLDGRTAGGMEVRVIIEQLLCGIDGLRLEDGVPADERAAGLAATSCLVDRGHWAQRRPHVGHGASYSARPVHPQLHSGLGFLGAAARHLLTSGNG